MLLTLTVRQRCVCAAPSYILALKGKSACSWKPLTPCRSPAYGHRFAKRSAGRTRTTPTGNLNRAILLLAIPMVLEMVLESLFAVVDVLWVGRLGANAVATVGLTESLLALVFSIGIGLAMSTTAMVARRIGEKDPVDAAIAGMQAIFLGLIVSLAIGVPSFVFAPQLLRLMGASPEIVVTGVQLRPHCTWRVRRHRHALPQQRHIPRSG